MSHGNVETNGNGDEVRDNGGAQLEQTLPPRWHQEGGEIGRRGVLKEIVAEY